MIFPLRSQPMGPFYSLVMTPWTVRLARSRVSAVNRWSHGRWKTSPSCWEAVECRRAELDTTCGLETRPRLPGSPNMMKAKSKLSMGHLSMASHGQFFLHFSRYIPNVHSSPQSLLGHQLRRNWVPCLSSSLSKGSPQLSALPLGLVYNPQSSTGQIVRRNSGIYGMGFTVKSSQVSQVDELHELSSLSGHRKDMSLSLEMLINDHIMSTSDL